MRNFYSTKVLCTVPPATINLILDQSLPRRGDEFEVCQLGLVEDKIKAYGDILHGSSVADGSLDPCCTLVRSELGLLDIFVWDELLY
jgi:hypothetical protein